ncbi:MAG: two-component system, NtrC family, response regulator HydG [Gemmatimonadales bacterium]|nr:two-component system, NtrC family, response regulator HydG [Gemmatimonadales bacterium]
MTERKWSIAVVQLSESFRLTLGDLARDLRASVVEWVPEGDPGIPAGTAVLVLLAGGSESTALDLLAELPPSSVPCYVIGAAADHRIAAAAVQRGARDYFVLPEDLDLLRRSLEREGRELEGRVQAGRFAQEERRTHGFETILGKSAALRQSLDQAARVAAHRDVTVLIGGETGTGKELLARAIHYESPRAAEPFVEINCAAIPVNLLESELFGHEKGAFTGAVSAKPGLFELAHGGTLFLDEVAALPLELQPKLLRALESRATRRVGGQQEVHVDIRLIAATHVDLRAAVRSGVFREDLYYRLNVVALSLPPLRDREGDVELLTETFVTRLATGYGLPVPPLTPELRTALRQHPWPGNVRELRNAIERALVLSPEGTLRAEELGMHEDAVKTGGGLPFPATLAVLNRAAVGAMLELTKGNKSEAARRLGISRPRLQRLLDGIDDAN